MGRYLTSNIYISLLICFFATAGKSQSISISGGWTINIPATNITEAGDNFTDNFTSAGTPISIDLSVSPKNREYNVYVNKSDVQWNPSLIVTVRRTSSGTNPDAPPPGSITGGTNPVSVLNTSTLFFSGQRARVDVNIEYALSGVSVTLPAKTYSTTIVYTIVQL